MKMDRAEILHVIGISKISCKVILLDIFCPAFCIKQCRPEDVTQHACRLLPLELAFA